MSDEGRHKFDDSINELQHRDPFAPFNIILTSGDRITIEDPFMMINGPVEIIYVVPRSGRTFRLRKNQIAALEELEQKPAA